MVAVADHVMVLARPDDATSNTATMFLLVSPDAPGRRVDLVWDTLGMRATRSDFMTLEECFVPDEALLLWTEDVLPFRRDGANWFWGSSSDSFATEQSPPYSSPRAISACRPSACSS